MRIYQWEEVKYQQAEIERRLLQRELVRTAVEANGPSGPALFFSNLLSTLQAVFTGLAAYGAESAKNCCTAEKRASAASF